MPSNRGLRAFLNSIPDSRVALQLLNVLDRVLPNEQFNDTAITAFAGGGQTSAKVLNTRTSFHEVTTVASAADSIALPAAKVGELHVIKNSGANSMQVFGTTPDTIDSVATATGVPQPAGEAVIYWCQVAGNYLRLGGVALASIFGDITVTGITCTDSSLGIAGQSTAQGGAVVITGGTSSTAGNLGGAVQIVGGTPGSTSVGGAVSVTGGAGGSASGNGAIASLVGGAGTASNGVGGIGKVVGGAGQGSGAGGAAQVTGGAGGATGIGGQVTITGGAPTDAAGGAVVIAGAAGVGTNRAGGLASVTGGASTGSATGGVASLVGGAASAATGAGGGVVVTAGDGNTTGAAGTIVITAGQGGSTNVAGGANSVIGGIGNGTGIGGIASLVGGAGGTGGATGKGGAAKVTGGASVATNADGGGAIVAGGAKNGGGFIGPVVLGNAQLTPIWYPQAAPAADGADSPITMTIAQMIAGIVSMTPTTGRAVTTPTGAEMDAGVAFADVPATFGFDFSVQNRAAFAATDDILTVTAGASGVTVTGSAVVSPGSTGRFRATRTAASTWIIYKIAG